MDWNAMDPKNTQSKEIINRGINVTFVDSVFKFFLRNF